MEARGSGHMETPPQPRRLQLRVIKQQEQAAANCSNRCMGCTGVGQDRSQAVRAKERARLQRQSEALPALLQSRPAGAAGPALLPRL